MRKVRFFILPLIVASFTSCFSQKRAVSVPVTCLIPYCGGARPTKEILAEAEKPKPYSEKTIIFVSNGRVDSARTDKAGILKKKLSAGKYRLLESWRYYHGTPDGTPLSNFDNQCLKTEWEKEFAILSVAKKSQKLEKKFDITEHCDRQKPCILESALGPERQ
jgi:hypothetical protein